LYSADVKNIYVILQQIYSGNYVTNFITIARVL